MANIEIRHRSTGSVLRADDGESVRDVVEAAVRGEADLADEQDRVDRWKIDQAEAFLRAFLSDGEKESALVYKSGEVERLSDRTLRKAAERIGVIIKREGVGREHRSLWFLPHSGTPALTETHTPGPESPAKGSVSESAGRSAGVRKKKSKKGG